MILKKFFLHKISFRILNLLTFITSIFLSGILLLLFFHSKNVILNSLIPFIYSLIFYDFFQLLSLVLLKYNFTEQFFNQLCQWTYYLKSSSEAGQTLTLIFLFGLSCHQIRYFLTHNHLPNSSRINSRALVFVCLLFIVYINNWITHLKVEKSHLITINESKYEIHIQELPSALYEISNLKTPSYERFIKDLDKYSQGDESNSLLIQNQSKIIHNPKDGSPHEILIRFDFKQLISSQNNRTKREDTSDDEQKK